MRTSKIEVLAVFHMWLKAVNGVEAKSYSDVSGYRLDFNGVYGGYRIEQILNDGGGVREVFNYRLPASEFAMALRMAIQTLDEQRTNANPLEEVAR